MQEKVEFPLYLMKERLGRDQPWEYKFLPFNRAAILFDSGWSEVAIGEIVILDENFNVRPTTKEDKTKISQAADEYSGSK